MRDLSIPTLDKATRDAADCQLCSRRLVNFLTPFSRAVDSCAVSEALLRLSHTKIRLSSPLFMSKFKSKQEATNYSLVSNYTNQLLSRIVFQLECLSAYCLFFAEPNCGNRHASRVLLNFHQSQVQNVVLPSYHYACGKRA